MEGLILSTNGASALAGQLGGISTTVFHIQRTHDRNTRAKDTVTLSLIFQQRAAADRTSQPQYHPISTTTTTTAMAETTVLYPKGTKFNMDYYLSSHMPLVGNSFKSKGLKGWKVLDFGSEAEYCVQATLEWDSQKSFETAAATEEMVSPCFHECGLRSLV